MTPYTVALVGADTPCATRIAAEVRFAALMEQSLGSADAVAEGYRAWQDASSLPAGDLARDRVQCAMRWYAAMQRAQSAVCKDLCGLAEGAHFDFSLASTLA